MLARSWKNWIPHTLLVGMLCGLTTSSLKTPNIPHCYEYTKTTEFTLKNDEVYVFKLYLQTNDQISLD